MFDKNFNVLALVSHAVSLLAKKDDRVQNIRESRHADGGLGAAKNSQLNEKHVSKVSRWVSFVSITPNTYNSKENFVSFYA